LELRDSTEPARPTSVSVNTSEINFDALGATQQANARLLDQNGQPLPNQTISWSSDDAEVASVDSTGLVAAVGEGTTQITAASGTLDGSIAVRVQQVPARAALRKQLELCCGTCAEHGCLDCTCRHSPGHRH
jgi:uncharacterized protein YjdB